MDAAPQKGQQPLRGLQSGHCSQDSPSHSPEGGQGAAVLQAPASCGPSGPHAHHGATTRAGQPGRQAGICARPCTSAAAPGRLCCSFPTASSLGPRSPPGQRGFTFSSSPPRDRHEASSTCPAPPHPRRTHPRDSTFSTKEKCYFGPHIEGNTGPFEDTGKRAGPAGRQRGGQECSPRLGRRLQGGGKGQATGRLDDTVSSREPHGGHRPDPALPVAK